MSQKNEEKLQEYKEYIDKILLLNNLQATTEYKEAESPDDNAHIIYKVGSQIGFICHVDHINSFGGAALSRHTAKHLIAKGFEDNEHLKVWSQVNKIELFVPTLMYPMKIKTYEE